MFLEASAFAVVIVLMLLLHILQRRALRDLHSQVERQARLIETMAARAAPPASSTSGRIARAPQSGTAALERRAQPVSARFERGADPPPVLVERRTPAPMPAIKDRHTPTGNARLAEEPKRPATSRHPQRGEWNPTHRITFTPDSGKPQSWLVAIVPAPYGHRVALTHAEWAAGVTPAWHCGSDGSWTCHGLRTPENVRGKVAIDEFTASHPV
jgi:hypothetical protein